MTNFLINTIKNVNLDPVIYLSQIYDGVGNIGKVKGAVVTFPVPQRFNSAMEVLGIF